MNEDADPDLIELIEPNGKVTVFSKIEIFRAREPESAGDEVLVDNQNGTSEGRIPKPTI